MLPVGFEPTHLTIVVLKTTPFSRLRCTTKGLDHSGTTASGVYRQNFSIHGIYTHPQGKVVMLFIKVHTRIS